MAEFRTLDDLDDVRGKRALVRVDLNVPMKDGRVTDATRIERVLPTIRELSNRGAKVVLLAHLGRPKGRRDEAQSLRPVAQAVEEALDHRVDFSDDCIGEEAAREIGEMNAGDVLLLENVRFHPGEEANEAGFADDLAALGDLYVDDAFSASHRAHASTEGIARRLPSYAGRSMEAELKALDAALGTPKRPVLAIVGGAKVSTKLDLLSNLVTRVDALAIGGGMANTFLLAQGHSIGRSLAEREMVDTARRIIREAADASCVIVLPTDAVVADSLEEGVATETVDVALVPDERMILDVGPDTAEAIEGWIDRAATVVWNGPLGAFEIAPFDAATMRCARHAAAETRAGRLVSIAGGGDTVAALNRAGVADDFTYVSTAGGAFLEWMEGKTLPGVAALSRQANAAERGGSPQGSPW